MSKPPAPKVTNAAGKSADPPLSVGKANAYAVSAGDVVTIDNTERGSGTARKFLLKRKGDDLVITWSNGEVATFENLYTRGLTETAEGLRGQTLVLEHEGGIAAVVTSHALDSTTMQWLDHDTPLLSTNGDVGVSVIVGGDEAAGVYRAMHLPLAQDLDGWILAAAVGIETLAVVSAAGGGAGSAAGVGSAAAAYVATDPATPGPPAWAKMASYADDNGTTRPAPTLQDYTSAGISGIGGAGQPTAAQINSVLASNAVAGADVNSLAKIQAIVDAYQALINGADGNGANDNTSLGQSEYAALGLKGLDNSKELSLMNDVIDALQPADVDTQQKLQLFATAVQNVMNTAAGITPAATLSDFATLGVAGVDATTLSAALKAIADTADDGSAISTLADLKAIVSAGVGTSPDATTSAINLIAAYAGDNGALSPEPGAADYATAGVVGIGAAGQPSVAEINSVLASTAVTNAEAATLNQIQSIVGAYQAVLTAADGNGANAAPALSQAQYASLGLAGFDNASALSLMNDVVGAAPTTGVDTQQALQLLADAVQVIMNTAAGRLPVATANDFSTLAIVGVDGSNLSSVLKAIANTANDGTELTTLTDLKAVVTTGINTSAAAANAITAYADDNGAAAPAPTAADYENSGVSGIGGAGEPTVAEINSVLASLPVAGIDTATLAAVQAIVAAYQAVRAGADGNGTNDNASLGQFQYGLLGLPGVDSDSEIALMNDVLDARGATAVDSQPKLRSLADAVQAIMNTAGGTAPSATLADFSELGVAGVIASNLAFVLDAIAATPADGSGVGSFVDLSAVVSAGIAAAATASAIKVIADYAQSNGATTPAPTASDYVIAGVAGIGGANQPTVAAINSVLASMTVTAAETNTVAKIQSLVDLYQSVLAGADGNGANNNMSLAAAQYAALGLAGLDNVNEISLMNDVVDAKSAAALDTLPLLQLVADAVQAMMNTAAGMAPAATIADFGRLGIGGVGAANLTAVQGQIAGKALAEVDSVSEIQALVNVLSGAPNQTVINIDITADSGADANDFVTKDAAQTITGTLSPAGLAPGQILLGSVDAGAHWTDISARVTGTAIQWTNVTLLSGANQAIVFKVRNAANEESPLTSKSYTLDTTRPTVAMDALQMGDSTVNMLDDNTVAISGSTTGVEQGQLVVVTLTDSANPAHSISRTAVVQVNGSWGLAGAQLADITAWQNGAIALKAEVNDKSGNAAVPATGSLSLDNVAPRITGVAVTSQPRFGGAYANGEVITITASFDEAVSFDDPSSTSLALQIGNNVRNASLAGGGGTSTLSFSYTVAADDVEANGIVISSLGTAGAAGDAAGNPAILTFGAIGPLLDQKVGSAPLTGLVPPTGLHLVASSDSGVSPMDGVTNMNYWLAISGNASPDASYIIYDDTNLNGELASYERLNVTPLAASILTGAAGFPLYTDIRAVQGEHHIYVVAVDDLGNQSAPSAPLVLVLDNRAPAIVDVAFITTGLTGGIYGQGDAIDIRFQFDEPVFLTQDASQINIQVGTNPRLASYVSGSGTDAFIYRYIVAADDFDSDGITIDTNALAPTILDAISDRAGNVDILTNPELLPALDQRVDGSKPGATPIVVDLGGDGIVLQGLGAGVRFDLRGDGAPIQLAWPTSDDAFLVVDVNRNGLIDDGHELIGSATRLEGISPHPLDGYDVLAQADQNGDGLIDAADPLYAQLGLWKDANSNARTDPGELVTLAQAGIQSLHIANVTGALSETDGSPIFARIGSYTDALGNSHLMADVWLTTGQPI